MKTSIFYLIMILSISCSSKKNIQNELLTIDLKKAIQEQSDIPVSQFVDDIKYIPLELTPESALSPGFRLQMTDEYIIICNYSRSEISLLVFERNTGKFIRKISKQGKGPDEFLRPLDNFYNPYDQKIYARGEHSIKTYNLEGEFLESFENIEVDGLQQSIDAFIDKEMYVCYMGSNKTRIAITNRSSEIKSYPQYNIWSDEEVLIDQNPVFFYWADKVSFKERSNDTVFYVSEEKLTPRYVLFSGDSKYPATLTRTEAIEQLTKPADYFETLNLFENSKYLFFDVVIGYASENSNPIRNFCVLDKTSNKLMVCRYDSESISSGFNDDISDFLQITPSTITENNEMIAILQPLDIANWKKTNQVESSKLKAKLPWLDDISELDNPVLVIGKCKN